MPYKQDIWMPAITITSSNNSFRLLENVGVTNDERIVTIAAGTYYGHGDATLTALPLLGLFDALATAINAVSTNTYSFTTIAPVQSSSFALSGILIKATGATVDFRIDWDDSDFTMDPAWFGFRLATTDDDYGQLTGNNPLVATDNILASTTSGSDEIITSDYTSSLRWYSKSFGTLTNGAADKRSFRYGNRKYSSSRLTDGVSVEWDSGRVRTFRYEWVPSQHLFATRGYNGGFTNSSDLDGYDMYQGFDQYVWEPMARLAPVLIQHDVTTPALSWIDPSGTVQKGYELVRLLSESQAQRFDSVASLRRRGGEFYDLEIEVQVDPSYDYANH